MTRWKSARFRGEGYLYPRHYSAAFASSSILCPPLHQSSLRSTLLPVKRNVGFNVFRSSSLHDDLTPAITPAALLSTRLTERYGVDRLRYLLVEPDSAFGSVGLTMLACSSLMLGLSSGRRFEPH